MSQGQWCGSVGRAVASNTRGPRFESSHWQKCIYIEHLFTVNCVLKRRKEKEAENGPFFKKKYVAKLFVGGAICLEAFRENR